MMRCPFWVALFLYVGYCTIEALLCNDDEIRCNDTVCIPATSTEEEKATCQNKTDDRKPSCPDNCSRCKDEYYRCAPSVLADIPLSATSIDISGETLNITTLCQDTRPYLQNLSIAETGIDHVGCLARDPVFVHLKSLNLSNNKIRFIPDLNSTLPSLRTLVLDRNPIFEIQHLAKVQISLQYVDINKIQWITNENYKVAPLSFETKQITAKRDPMGSIIACYYIALDLRHNSITRFDSFGHCTILTRLDLSYNKIKVMDYDSLNGMAVLEYLDLSHNYMKTIDTVYFIGMTNLLELDLSYNKLESVGKKAFFDLIELKKLYLNNNVLRALPGTVFISLTNLVELNLQENRLKDLSSKTFLETRKLLRLDLHDNNLTKLREGTFINLGKLDYLDIRGNSIQSYETIFSGLGILQYLLVHSFTLCCARPTSVEIQNCKAPADIFSSCSNLINIGFLSVCIWFTGVLSLLGNAAALVYRIREGTWVREMRDIFVSCLCISDMFMGIYLFIIAYTDVSSRGEYGYYHQIWTASKLCNIAGVIVTVSSEASTFFILCITIDRYVIFRYPFSTFPHKRAIAYVTSVLIWIIAAVVAIFPLIFGEFFGDTFYTRSSVCISLPLTTTTLKYSGWEYSVGVFIGLNLFIYIFIVLGQLFVFKEIRNSGIQTDQKRAREIAVAKSLSAVVISDTLCWLPIAIVGFFALNGFDISNDIYAWIIVFVLPINSAINPFLYTLLAMRRKKKKASSSKTSKDPSTERLHIVEIRPLTVPSCGLSLDTVAGCMIILTEPDIEDKTDVDVIFSDSDGWSARADDVKILYQIIRCSVPAYKTAVQDSVMVKVHVVVKKTKEQTPPVNIRYIQSPNELRL